MAQRNLSRALVDNCVEAGRGGQAAIREPKPVSTFSRPADEIERPAGASRVLRVAPGHSVEPWTPAHDPEDGAPAFILYSGAPGDDPHATAHDHAATGYAFEAYAKHVLALDPSDRVLSATKLSTAYGLGLGLLFPLMAGAA